MSLLSRLAKGVGTFTKNIGKGISHLAKGISHGIGSVAKGFGKVVRSTAKALWDNPFLRTIALGSAAYFTGGMLAPMLSTSLNIGMGAASMLGSTASGAILGGLGSMAAGKGFGHGALFGGLTGLAAGYLPSLVGANNGYPPSLVGANNTTQGGLLGPILGKGKSMVEGITHFADAHPGMAMMALAGVQNAFTPDQIDLQNNQAKLQRQNLAYRQALNQVPVDNSGMVVSGGSGSVGYMQGGGIQGGGQQGQNTVPVQNGLLVTATPWVYQ